MERTNTKKSREGVSSGEGTGGRSAGVGRKRRRIQRGGRSEEGKREKRMPKNLLGSGCKLVFGFFCLAEPNKTADGDG
jgi:hypothetical protein